MSNAPDLVVIILAFARISSFLFFLPFLSGRTVPSVAKIAISAGLAFAVVGKYQVAAIEGTFQFIGYIIVQIIIGLTLAKLVEFLINVPKIAGALMDMDMGFTYAQIFDPGTRQSTTILSTLFNAIFVIVFIKLDGLQQLIITLIRSFELTETLRYLGNYQFLEFVFGVALYMLSAAVQIALPVMGAMFILTFVLMIIGKSATKLQNQIFTTMFSIKITLGILFIAVILPIMNDWFGVLTDRIISDYIEAFSYIFKK